MALCTEERQRRQSILLKIVLLPWHELLGACKCLYNNSLKSVLGYKMAFDMQCLFPEEKVKYAIAAATVVLLA